MRRIRVAQVERPSQDEGHVEDLLAYAALLCGIVVAAFLLGAQLYAALGGLF